VSTGDSLLVRVLRKGSNLDWYAPMPPVYLGKTYMMFLKRDAVGYYPFQGFNGFLEFWGEEMILNDHVPYSMTPSDLTAAVRKALGNR